MQDKYIQRKAQSYPRNYLRNILGCNDLKRSIRDFDPPLRKRARDCLPSIRPAYVGLCREREWLSVAE